VNQRRRIFVQLVLAIGLLAPAASAQKPPAPIPVPPASPAPAHPAGPVLPGSQPTESDADLVMILLGRVATNDGTFLPNDTLVERVCNERVRQQVYATLRGDFSMQMGSQAGTLLDATGDSAADWPSQHGAVAGSSQMGITRRELSTCEIRASASGFLPRSISLLGLTPSSGTVDAGAIVLQRAAKIEGATLNVTPYKAPPNARKAYEKGLQAEKKLKLAEAQSYFEKALQIHPAYAGAWFQLGAVLEKQNQKDSARKAYTQATVVDTKFLPPYLSLASLAYEAENWTEVIRLAGHVSDLDPFSSTIVKEYMLDLDELNLAAAYFYGAVANYKLDKIEEAKKSALKAEHIDLHAKYPQLHVLLAEIFLRMKDYPVAISELKTYLEVAPHAQNADQIRVQLAKLEELNRSASTTGPSFQN